MLKRAVIGLLTLFLVASCEASSKKFDWASYQAPDWRKYQARAVAASADGKAPAGSARPAETGRVTFGDLKSESDESLAKRLLGAAGQRIAYIDRHRDRWHLYASDSEASETLDLYTRPEALGSQYGLCGSEKYSISFDDSGNVASVSVSQRYGVEGPIYQWPISDQDWENYWNVMCASAPATRGPSYYPAPDTIAAHNVALLMIPIIDLASSLGPLPFQLNCEMYDGSACPDDVRGYLRSLRLEDIEELTLANCPLSGGPEAVCFSLETGRGMLGPYPKTITVKGSTHMKRLRVDSVDINSGFTIS